MFRNFCELPIGTVCVADVQTKGRGLIFIQDLVLCVIMCPFQLPFWFKSKIPWALKLSGRSKNVWESPLGCLMFSFTLQMEDGRVVPLVQYVVSLAITEAIKDICYKNVSALFWSTDLAPSLPVNLIWESCSRLTNLSRFIFCSHKQMLLTK